MQGKIKKDQERLRELLKSAGTQKLKEMIRRGQIIGKRGKDLISIPVPEVEIPIFRHGGPRTQGGAGQGKGEIGQPVGFDPNGEPDSGAGNQPGEHILEMEFSFEEIAELIAEEFDLPYLQSRGKESIEEEKIKYTGVYTVGPESLRHRRRTFKQTLKREFASLNLPLDADEEDYDLALEDLFGTPDRQVPLPPDKRYRSWKIKLEPQANAVMIFMMDVSGSMGDKEKELVRKLSWLIRICIIGHKSKKLRKKYAKVQTRWLIHDATAKEVDEESFFTTRESGGTMISSAYELCRNIIDGDYPIDQWNIYPFHFSDGDNWGGGDTERCVNLLQNEILPKVNLFCYGQVENPYASGRFAGELKKAITNMPKLRISDSDMKVNSDPDFKSAMRIFFQELKD